MDPRRINYDETTSQSVAREFTSDMDSHARNKEYFKRLKEAEDEKKRKEKEMESAMNEIVLREKTAAEALLKSHDEKKTSHFQKLGSAFVVNNLLGGKPRSTPGASEQVLGESGLRPTTVTTKSVINTAEKGPASKSPNIVGGSTNSSSLSNRSVDVKFEAPPVNKINSNPVQDVKEETLGENAIVTQIDEAGLKEALADNMNEWGRSKLMIVGEGRAGKTAFANTLVGKEFKETESTVGINTLSCNVNFVSVDERGEAHVWDGDSKEPEKLLETTLAKKMLRLSNLANNPLKSVAKPFTSAALPIPASKSVSSMAKQVTHTQEIQSLDRERVSEDYVLKVLADSIQSKESKFTLSIYDFGGQSVFNVIHAFFLTRYGVYFIVFNMEWMLSNDSVKLQDCLSSIQFWMNSVAVHTSHKRDGTIATAPVALVGTHKDKITNPVDHEMISNKLQSTFRSSIVWPYLIENSAAEGSKGVKTLVYFPVDNKMGRRDPVVRKLMVLTEQIIDVSDYVHALKPLGWFKVMDELNIMTASNPCTSLDRIIEIAKENGIPSGLDKLDDPPDKMLDSTARGGLTAVDMLRFFHGVGQIMWHQELSLRDTIILNPIKYLIKPATLVICKHSPNAGNESTQSADATIHSLPVHEACKKKYHHEFVRMIDQGIVSERLLRALMESETKYYDSVRQMMVKYGLIVPLFNEAQEDPVKRLYVVPSLLPKESDIEALSLRCTPSVTPGDCVWNFCFAFYADSGVELFSQQTYGRDLVKDGFLPTGVFERLIGKALKWSLETYGDLTATLFQLMKNKATLYIGSQEFIMTERLDLNCIIVTVPGPTPVAVHERLKEFVLNIIEESFNSLKIATLVPYTHQANLTSAALKINSNPNAIAITERNQLFLNVKMVQDRIDRGEPLRLPSRQLLSHESLEAQLDPWLERHRRRDNFDVFLSYMWNPYDKPFANKLRDRISLHQLPADGNRAINVFIDTDKLVNGEELQASFVKALVSSVVFVPIFSYYPLVRMLTHDPSKVDNVLLEWLCAQICHMKKNNKMQYILPIALGKRVNENILECESLYKSEVIDRLPEIEPAATLQTARKLLFENGVLSTSNEDLTSILPDLTVKGIVYKLSGFLSITPSSADSKRLGVLECCASEIQKLANKPRTRSDPNGTAANISTATNAKAVDVEQLLCIVKELQDHIKGIVATKDLQLKEKDEQLSSRDKLINQLSVHLMDKDKQLSSKDELNNRLIEQNRSLTELLPSKNTHFSGKDERDDSWQAVLTNENNSQSHLQNSRPTTITRNFLLPNNSAMNSSSVTQNFKAKSPLSESSLQLELTCPQTWVPVRNKPSRDAPLTRRLYSDDVVTVKRKMTNGFVELTNGQGFINLAVSGVTWYVCEPSVAKASADSEAKDLYSSSQTADDTGRTSTSTRNPLRLQETFRPRTNKLVQTNGSGSGVRRSLELK